MRASAYVPQTSGSLLWFGLAVALGICLGAVMYAALIVRARTETNHPTPPPLDPRAEQIATDVLARVEADRALTSDYERHVAEALAVVAEDPTAVFEADVLLTLAQLDEWADGGGSR